MTIEEQVMYLAENPQTVELRGSFDTFAEAEAEARKYHLPCVGSYRHLFALDDDGEILDVLEVRRAYRAVVTAKGDGSGNRSAV